MRWLLLINLLAVVLLSGAVAVVLEGTPIGAPLREAEQIDGPPMQTLPQTAATAAMPSLLIEPDPAPGLTLVPEATGNVREGNGKRRDVEAPLAESSGHRAAPIQLPVPRPSLRPPLRSGERAVEGKTNDLVRAEGMFSEQETVSEETPAPVQPVLQPVQPVLQIATEGAFAPFNFRDEKGEPTGFDIDIAKELCRRIKRACSFVILPWPALKPALIAGQVDVLAASLQIPAQADPEILFSDPYYGAHGRFVGPRDASSHDGGVSGAVPQPSAQIAVQSGSRHAAFLADAYPSNALVLTATFEAALEMVEAGKVEVAFGDNATALRWVKDKACCKVLDQPLSQPLFFGKGIGLAVRSDEVDLLKEINQALRALVSDGTYDRLSNNYFGASIY